jgi:hypothetical protein
MRGWSSCRGWQGGLLLVAVLGAVLVLVNAVLFEINRSLQTQVTSRAQYIQQTVQLEALNREIVSAIANLASRNNDEALRAVLAQHGITINPPPGAGTPAAPPAAGPAGK